MNSSLAPQDTQTALRYMLALAGGWLATHGYIPNADVNDLVSALMILGPIIWGVWKNHQLENNAQKREMVAVQAGLNLAAAGKMETIEQGGEIVAKPVTPETTKAIIAEHGVSPVTPVQPVMPEAKP